MKAEINDGVLIVTPSNNEEDKILIQWYRDNRKAKEIKIQINRN